MFFFLQVAKNTGISLSSLMTVHSWYISTKTQSNSLEIERLRREVQDLVD